ncbi:dephospho-CoA kinase [Paenibacillus pasadenensis]|uniref:Dephospho-CoA kinase n=1 Tax=Paenibacillus pasadenensis TaxID=217090 RepID=A0A2N5N4I3_9BACL|nr:MULTISPECIES: dephospho-CoA kinase [Paenibacillus]PLT45241.1 Dephospho-CoA kinase [Paenibacillus pasadenensis]QGG55625.1 dephospho-CoA kinase [Paenibacillus sp. B01]
MRIGLTGGIASGKSTVSRMLREKGVFVSDADEAARAVVEPGEPALAAIAAAFGEGVLQPDGRLDRPALGRIVFGQPDKLRQLEGILHPAIRRHMQAEMEQAERERPERLVVADIPLLYETGQDAAYDGVLVVYVPADVQLERLIKRSGMDETEARRRIGLQLDLEEKKRRADWVIDNGGSEQETMRQAERFLAERGIS